MLIRFELARSRSYYWPWFVKRARAAGKYRFTGGASHSVEISDEAKAFEVWRIIRSWKGVVVSVNGRAVSAARFTRAMWDAERKPARTFAMLQEIIERKAAERDRGDDGMRWKMGLGPEPGR